MIRGGLWWGLALGSLIAPVAASAELAAPRPEVVRNLAGADLATLRWGRGPLIVLLPSLGRGAEDFDAIAPAMAREGYSIVAVDPPGLNGSTPLAKGTTLHDLAKRVAALIERQKKGPAIIVGHAFGAFVARTLATDRPDLVRGVVIAAGSAGKRRPGDNRQVYRPEVVEAIARSSSTTLSKDERLAALSLAFFAPGSDPSVWLEGWHDDIRIAQTAAHAATPIDDYFRTGCAPILLLQAASDQVAPIADDMILRDLIGPRVTVHVIPSAGHALLPEQPAKVTKEILEFARRLPSAASRCPQ